MYTLYTEMDTMKYLCLGGLVVALGLLVGCESSKDKTPVHDLSGNWLVRAQTDFGPQTFRMSLAVSGNRISGQVIGGDTLKGKVSGNEVRIVINSDEPPVLEGTIADANNMSGSFKQGDVEGVLRGGTWTATRY